MCRKPRFQSALARSRLAGVAVCFVLDRPRDRFQPMLSPHDPQLVVRTQVTRSIIQTAEPNFDLVIAVMGTEQTRAAYWTIMAVIRRLYSATCVAHDGNLALVPDSKGHEGRAGLPATCHAMADPNPLGVSMYFEPDSAAVTAALMKCCHTIYPLMLTARNG
jgi:hypothetical protein